MAGPPHRARQSQSLADRHPASSPAPARLDALVDCITDAGVAVIGPISAVAIIGIRTPAIAKSVVTKATMMEAAVMKAAVTMAATCDGLMRGCRQEQRRGAGMAETISAKHRRHRQRACQSVAKVHSIIDHKDYSAPEPVGAQATSVLAATRFASRQRSNHLTVTAARNPTQGHLAGYPDRLKAVIETGLAL